MAKPRNASYRKQLIEAIRQYVPSQWFSQWSSHGNADWTPQLLCWMALLMSWDEASTLRGRFENTRTLLKEMFPWWKLGSSYSGFVQALQRETPWLRKALIEHLQKSVEQWAGQWRVYGWLIFAVDGSRFECPRTQANEERLGCAGKEKTAPQVFQTTLQHVGTGLPWDFRLGPGTDSERRHLDQMLDGLPASSLLTADAGFISFDLCRWLLTQNHAFLLRVGSNVHLLAETEGEVRGGRVYLWPQKRRHQPPVVLRLIVIQEPGKEPVYLVTNLDEDRLSEGTAAKIYELRWGVEVYYRSLKQTLDRSTLLSHSPQAALCEQTWTVLGAWLLQLTTASALIEAGQQPRSWSAAQARDVIRHTVRMAIHPTCGSRSDCLRQQFSRCCVDSYFRGGPKQTRPCARKKRERPPGPPNIRLITSKERQRAGQLLNVS